MSLLALIPVRHRWLLGGGLTLALLLGAIGLGWVVQGWRLGQQLAERDRIHADTLTQLHDAAAREIQRAQSKRLTLEQQLQASSQTQYRRLGDAERKAARLPDRLATAELRLSVLTAEPAAARAGRLVDGAPRADLDRGAAQRIVDITGRGDRAIVALGMCQDYVRTLSETLWRKACGVDSGNPGAESARSPAHSRCQRITCSNLPGMRIASLVQQGASA